METHQPDYSEFAVRRLSACPPQCDPFDLHHCLERPEEGRGMLFPFEPFGMLLDIVFIFG
jgi:hypothetical protein